MKNFKKISILFSILFFQMLTAQFSKGNWMVEGSIGNISISNNKNDYSSETTSSNGNSNGFSFGLNPRAGYFVTNNFVTGLSVYLYLGKSSGESTNVAGIKTSDSESSSNTLSVSPFVRYYFPSNKKLRFYTQLEGGIDTSLSNKSLYNSYNPTTGAFSYSQEKNFSKKDSGFSANALIGVNYFLSKNVALNTGVAYSISKSSNTYNYIQTNSAGIITNTPETSATYNYSSIGWRAGFTMIID